MKFITATQNIFQKIFQPIQFINRNIIKYIAIITMVCDHIAYSFVTSGTTAYWILRRLIGRIAFPLFSTLVVEGMTRTHHLVKNVCLLAIFAVVSEPLFDYMRSGTLLDFSHQNVLWSYFAFGLVYFIYTKTETKKKNLTIIRYIGIILLCIGTSYLMCFCHVDYNWHGLAGMYIGYILYKWTNQPFMITLPIVVLCFIQSGRWTYAIPLVIMVFYSQKKECSHTSLQKYSEYAFYPFHMGIIDIIINIIG